MPLLNLNPPMVAAAVDSVVAIATHVWEERGVGSLSHNIIFSVLFSFAYSILIRIELVTLLKLCPFWRVADSILYLFLVLMWVGVRSVTLLFLCHTH